MKVKFCRPGRSAPSLLNATPLMAPIRKVTNVCRSALTIITGHWVHYDVEDDKV